MKKSLETRLFNSTKISQKTQKLEQKIKLLVLRTTQYFHQLLLIRQCSASGFLSKESQFFFITRVTNYLLYASYEFKATL